MGAKSIRVLPANRTGDSCDVGRRRVVTFTAKQNFPFQGLFAVGTYLWVMVPRGGAVDAAEPAVTAQAMVSGWSLQPLTVTDKSLCL
jgi:hypothetical protein